MIESVLIKTVRVKTVRIIDVRVETVLIVGVVSVGTHRVGIHREAGCEGRRKGGSRIEAIWSRGVGLIAYLWHHDRNIRMVDCGWIRVPLR